MSMEPMDETIQPGSFSPEHVVGEHRVALGRMTKLAGSGTEFGVVLGLFDGPRDQAYLVAMRLLTSAQAMELAEFLIRLAVDANAHNAAANQEKEGA